MTEKEFKEQFVVAYMAAQSVKDPDQLTDFYTATLANDHADIEWSACKEHDALHSECMECGKPGPDGIRFRETNAYFACEECDEENNAPFRP